MKKDSLLIKSTVETIVTLLSEKKYTEIVDLTMGERLDESEIEEAVAEYGRKLLPLPESVLDKIDIYKIDGSRFYSVISDLWTEEEGISDLSLLLRVKISNKNTNIILDGIRVL